MRKILSLISAALLLPAGLMAQQDVSVKYAGTITPDDMRTKLTVLASDEFEGRETGTEGQKKASKFLEDFYAKIGLEGPVDGTYRQKFNMYQSNWENVYVKAKSGKIMNGEGYIFAGYANMSKEMKLSTAYLGEVNADTDFSAYKDMGVIIIGGDREVMAKANEAGVKAMFVASADDEQFASRLPRFVRGYMNSRLRFVEQPSEENIIFYITKGMAADMMATSVEKLEDPASVKNRNVRFRIQENRKTVETENMMAYLEGTDLKDEVLVISSHYDHIGQNEDGTVINNGADDDGSGTTGVMEIAEAFAQAAEEGNRPRRSILFLNVTGEEKGLLGSAYYADNPIFPIENTVNNLNIDMIGRVDPEHEESGNRDYVYVIGSEKLSSHLKIISEYANITYTGIDLDYRYDDPNDRNRFYYRSDHYNFAKSGIPIIFYFNGTHADYHRSTDTVDKIAFDVMAKRAQLVFHTAWLLANRDERTPVDKEDDMDYGSR